MAWNDFLKGYTDTEKAGFMGAGGLMGAGLGSMFSDWQNPSRGAGRDIGRIPGMMNPYYEPYSQAGQRMIPGLEGQYGSLMNDPGGMLNKIGQGYHQSPGFQFALQQALGAGNRAMAAGGMAGSPMHEQQNMETATQLGNQDYNNWLQQATGMYGRGLTGAENLMNTGYGAGNEYAQSMGNMGLQQALMKYLGQMSQNQHEGGGMGAFMGGLGSFLPALFM